MMALRELFLLLENEGEQIELSIMMALFVSGCFVCRCSVPYLGQQNKAYKKGGTKMNKLSTYKLRQLIVKSGMTMDEYVEKLLTLQEDIEFFNLYMKRNKKSGYELVVKVIVSAGRAFDDVWRKYGSGTDKDSIERTFAETTLLSVIFKDMYDGTDIYSDDEIRSFKSNFEMYNETKMEDYISDFIGCSRGCMDVARQLEMIETEDR